MLEARKRRAREGLTLVEAAVVLCIAGIALAVFVPAFFAEIRTSKVAEATDALAMLHRQTAAYFATDHVADGLHRRWCLPEPAGPTPPEPWYDPVDVDFHDAATPGHATWSAIGFQPGPIRYRYSLIPETTGCGVRRPAHVVVVTYRAEGDLDEDGLLSRFEWSDSVDEEGALVPEGALAVTHRVE